MPGSIIGELILRPILEFCFFVIGYYMGRAVVAIISFGRIKCDRITTDTPRRKLKWAGSYHLRGQRIYLTAEATAGVGLLFVALVIGGGFLIYFLRT